MLKQNQHFILNQLSSRTFKRVARIYSSHSQHFHSKRRRSNFSWKSFCAVNCSPGKNTPWEATSVNSLSFAKTPRQKYRLVRQVDRTGTYHIWSKISHPKMMRVSLWDLSITQYSHESALPTSGLLYASPVQGSLHSVLCQEPSLQLLLLRWSLISTDINTATLARQCKNPYQYS